MKKSDMISLALVYAKSFVTKWKRLNELYNSVNQKDVLLSNTISEPDFQKITSDSLLYPFGH